jgi:hypothetical protein
MTGMRITRSILATGAVTALVTGGLFAVSAVTVPAAANGYPSCAGQTFTPGAGQGFILCTVAPGEKVSFTAKAGNGGFGGAGGAAIGGGSGGAGGIGGAGPKMSGFYQNRTSAPVTLLVVIGANGDNGAPGNSLAPGSPGTDGEDGGAGEATGIVVYSTQEVIVDLEGGQGGGGGTGGQPAGANGTPGTNGAAGVINAPDPIPAGFTILSTNAFEAPAVTFVRVVDRSITIRGKHRIMDGRWHLAVNGRTVDLNGERVVARVRLAGQQGYSDRGVRTVSDNGTFTWQLETGRKAYIYFATEDGSVRSARIVVNRGAS